jgi:hypothetical protein
MLDGDIALFDSFDLGLKSGNSGQYSSHNFAFRCALLTVDLDGECRVFGTGWEDQISECREDTGEALQATASNGPTLSLTAKA